MGYKLWTTGELLTSSDLNSYLMNQAVITCTSGTRPSSPTEGMTIYETDTDSLLIYNGGWKPAIDQLIRSYSPTFAASASGGSVGNGSLIGRYARIGPWTLFQITFTIGTTTSAGTGRWFFSLPSAPAMEGVASAFCEDASASARYGGATWLTSAAFSTSVGAGGNIGVSGTVPFTWANTDVLFICGHYVT